MILVVLLKFSLFIQLLFYEIISEQSALEWINWKILLTRSNYFLNYEKIKNLTINFVIYDFLENANISFFIDAMLLGAYNLPNCLSISSIICWKIFMSHWWRSDQHLRWSRFGSHMALINTISVCLGKIYT
jgi:hypothetical protein